jgi:choline dehydrogenase-like flavoprotein
VTLPAAARTGRLTLVSDAIVSHVTTNAEGRAQGVAYIDRMTLAHREARARVVVLAAGALESTRILLNSRSARFPNGLGNSSGVLGHYLMDHITLEGAGGIMPSLKSSVRNPVGNPAGYLIPKYVNTPGGPEDKRFLRGFRFDGGADQELYAHAFGIAGYGQEWRRKVSRQIPYYFGIEAQGECLPRFDNYVALDREVKDAWGIPVLHIVASYGENETKMREGMREAIGEILDAMKLEEVEQPQRELQVFGKNIHECGTARMGNNPKTSVLNRFNQLHDVKNVFVTDGACFVTQGCYEPTLTIMAISARAAAYIADEYRRGNV